jgi:hypothetical protein
MLTAQWIKMQMMQHASPGERIPPLNAVEVLLCQCVDKANDEIATLRSKVFQISTRGDAA